MQNICIRIFSTAQCTTSKNLKRAYIPTIGSLLVKKIKAHPCSATIRKHGVYTITGRSSRYSRPSLSSEGWLFYTISYGDWSILRFFISAGGPGTNLSQIPRDDYVFTWNEDNAQNSVGNRIPFVLIHFVNDIYNIYF